MSYVSLAVSGGVALVSLAGFFTGFPAGMGGGTRTLFLVTSILVVWLSFSAMRDKTL
ncbi:MAG: hypothetical protein HY608_03325 [Planctomycetes bacterium]|nr:hypothetical protein [Planctomycetota bacterium]